MTIQRHGTTARYSDSVIHNGTVYLVEVPTSLEADITTQTQEVLSSIDTLLTQAGSDKSRLLLVTIYLKDMADYDAMNVVWESWLPTGTSPTRACLEPRLSNPGYRIEIVVIAAQ